MPPEKRPVIPTDEAQLPRWLCQDPSHAPEYIAASGKRWEKVARKWVFQVFTFDDEGLANQIAWDVWQYVNGLWTVAFSLPLQICTLSGVLCAVLVLTRSYRLFELLYFWGLAGAGNGLVTPDLLIYGFPHFRYWLFFSAHGAIIVAIAFMIAT